MQKELYLIMIFLLTGLSSKAGEDIAHRTFKLIYNQQYDSAHYLLNENKDQLDRFYYTVLDIDLSYWENVTGTDQPHYANFEDTLQKYNSKDPESCEEQVVSLVVLSYQLRYELKRYRIFSAIQTRKKTLALYTELKNNPPAFDKEQKEVFQLYNALIVYFNHYLGSFFSKSSQNEIQAAISEMEILSHSEFDMVKTLCSYFLGKTYLQYEKEPEKGIRLFTYLSENYPNNQRFPEYLSECREKAEN